MKLYFVGTDECGVMVVHNTAREAKRLGYEQAREFNSDCDFVDVYVRRVREVVVPPEVTEPAVYDSCSAAPWTCLAWRYDDDCCDCTTGDLCGKVDPDAEF